MARLRKSHSAGPGISRRRRGKGFSYAYPDGQAVTDEATLERIRRLAVPPAWVDVWICPWPNGHIQAIGTDAAGRRQYRYHDDWRVHQDREKFERVLAFAAVLPRLRRKVAADLAGEGLGRDRVLAAIVRLLDVGCFRIGGEEYAAEHETFGVASLRKEHVTIRKGVMAFDYPAKGSIERALEVRDPISQEVVAALRRRRSGGPNLFAYQDGRRWVAVHADDVNMYIKAVVGEQYSAKDFRTWSATVLAAAALAGQEVVPASRTGRRRAVAAAVAAVAEQLGNTPAVCRSAYIDPRVIDRFDSGETIADRLTQLPPLVDLPQNDRRRSIEEAVIDLLDGPAQAAGTQAA
jgi:DNA topoisomerase IB